MGKHSHHYTEYLRAELEAEIERLIALCDSLDGDPDIESDGDLEPDADSEPDSDDEPALGWSNWGAQQGHHDLCGRDHDWAA